jgi:hypothetical protein
LLALFAFLVPSGAHSQAIDWIATEDGIILGHDPGSARLEGMGGLSIAVPDESNKLDLNHYGGNVSALLWESDAARWDFWTHAATILHDSFDAGGVRQRDRVQTNEYGGRMAWRSKGRRVLGLDYSYDAINQGTGPLEQSKVRGPMWGVFGGQQVARVVLGGGIHLIGDNQDRTSTDFFAIRHKSSGQRYVGSLAIDAGPLVLGLQSERQVNQITGDSRDEARFHEDIYTWKRPVETYSGSAVWSFSDVLRGAVRARAQKIDGREDVRISWSDRMPENPARTNILVHAGTFDERGRNYEVGSRWEMRPSEAIFLTADGSIARTSTKIVEGSNFKGSQRAEDSKEHLARAGGAVSYQAPSKRLRVGAEGWFIRDSRDDAIAATSVVARTLELRTGAEYFVQDAFAIRAGYLRSAEDEDTSLPRTLGIGNGFSIGGGYFPRGGLYQIDAAIRVEKVLPNYDGNPRSEKRRTYFSLGARFLF